MELAEIKEQIKAGLTKGYWQNLLLLSSYSNFIEQVREYLLTVNVAQQLLEWNKNPLYKIQLEYSVSNFYNNAFAACRWESKSIFNMTTIPRKTGHSPTKKQNQKIDIAITKGLFGSNASSDERTLCGIELKAINKCTTDIIEDLTRLSDAMILTDDVSPNSIDFCFCGFIRRFDREKEIVNDNFILTKTTEEQNYWEPICKDLANKYLILEFLVEKFDIVTTPLELVADTHRQLGSDYSEVANSTGIVVGYIITIKRKLVPKP